MKSGRGFCTSHYALEGGFAVVPLGALDPASFRATPDDEQARARLRRLLLKLYPEAP